MLKRLRWSGLAVLLAITMILAGCTGGDDRTSMEILEDMIEKEMTSDYVHSEGSITVGLDVNDAGNETGSETENSSNMNIMPSVNNLFGDMSEITIHYEIQQSTELARMDATLSADLGGMTLEVPLIITETDLFIKIPIFTNDFVRVPLDTINENETTAPEFDLDQIKAIILDLADILKDIMNEDWLTLQATEDYEGTLDPEELAFIIQLELNNERLQELLDRLYEEQDRIQEWVQDVESIVESQNAAEDILPEDEFSISEEELLEAKEELQNNFDLEQFEVQVAIDNEDHLRELTMEVAGKSLVNEPAETASLRLNHTVISINEPFEFEQTIPENAVLLEDLFGGMQ